MSKVLTGLIEDVLAELHSGRPVGANRVGSADTQHGVYPTVDQALSAARQAHQTLVVLPLEKRKEIIANIRRKAANRSLRLATLAVEETGLGRVEDKIKNLLVIHKTPGTEILQPTACRR